MDTYIISVAFIIVSTIIIFFSVIYFHLRSTFLKKGILDGYEFYAQENFSNRKDMQLLENNEKSFEEKIDNYLDQNIDRLLFKFIYTNKDDLKYLVPMILGTINKADKKLVSAEQVYEYLEDICEYANEISPTLIVGVNRGGIKTAAYIINKLRLNADQLLKCSVPITDAIECSIIGSPTKKNAFDRVLIVDDVSRTGCTMKRVVNFIRQKFKIDGEIYTAALINAAANGVDEPKVELSYYVKSTTYPDIRLPWHNKDNDPHMVRAIVAKHKAAALKESLAAAHFEEKETIDKNEERRQKEFDKLANQSLDDLISDITEKDLSS